MKCLWNYILISGSYAHCSLPNSHSAKSLPGPMTVRRRQRLQDMTRLDMWILKLDARLPKIAYKLWTRSVGSGREELLDEII